MDPFAVLRRALDEIVPGLFCPVAEELTLEAAFDLGIAYRGWFGVTCAPLRLGFPLAAVVCFFYEAV